MSFHKPVVAIGERMYIGPLGQDNIEKAKATNFGDCWETDHFDWPQMAQDLIHLLKNPKARARTAKTGYELVQSEYSMSRIYPALEKLYDQVLLEKNLSLVHEIPVLMYHQVLPEAPPVSKYNLHVTAADLEKQLQFLKARGFETVTFEDLMKRRLPRKPVILTFDDGYENNYHFLLPLLKKHLMKAVIYILGNRRHRTNFWDVPQGEAEHALLTPAQIKTMTQSGLVEFGSHSLNHSKLTLLKPKELEKEIAGSKTALEAFLRKPVVSFAYPYGFVNEEIKKMTAAAGYTFGIGVNNGPSRFKDDLMEIRRVHLFPKTSAVEYWKKTSGFYLRYRAFTRKLRGR
jgi:peptidoglycan/xylan/chitin deacetylase (PgdA/CDA1 family)